MDREGIIILDDFDFCDNNILLESKPNIVYSPSISKRLFYLDILHIVAIFGTITLHQNGQFWQYSPKPYWESCLLLECLFYYAVPLFALISGATLLPYKQKYDTFTFFKKRFLKILIPSSAWITIMAFWKIYIIKTLKIKPTLYSIYLMVIDNQEEGTYYYIWVVLGIYLTIPILSHLSYDENRGTLIYAITTFFIFNSLLPDMSSAYPKFRINTDFHVLISTYSIYLLIGYYLSTEKLNLKCRLLIYICGILGTYYRFSTTLYYSRLRNRIDNRTWKNKYLSFHAITQSSAVFLFFKRIHYNAIMKFPFIKSFIESCASCTFGVYLLHKIVLYYERIYFNADVTSLEWRLLGSFLTYAISVLIIFTLKQIPVIQKFVA